MAWIRARQLQLLLTHIDRLPELERRAVCDRIHAPDVVQIQKAQALEWIPMKLGIDLSHAVIEGLGRERARTFFRDQFAVTLNNAVLGSLVQAITRHLSNDPRPGMRWLSRGHDLLFRDVGRLIVDVAPDKPEAILSLVDLSPEFAADRMWLDRYAWSLASLQILWRGATDCEVIESNPEARLARFRMWWIDPRAARSGAR